MPPILTPVTVVPALPLPPGTAVTTAPTPTPAASPMPDQDRFINLGVGILIPRQTQIQYSDAAEKPIYDLTSFEGQTGINPCSKFVSRYADCFIGVRGAYHSLTLPNPLTGVPRSFSATELGLNISGFYKIGGHLLNQGDHFRIGAGLTGARRSYSGTADVGSALLYEFTGNDQPSWTVGLDLMARISIIPEFSLDVGYRFPLFASTVYVQPTVEGGPQAPIVFSESGTLLLKANLNFL